MKPLVNHELSLFLLTTSAAISVFGPNIRQRIEHDSGREDHSRKYSGFYRNLYIFLGSSSFSDIKNYHSFSSNVANTVIATFAGILAIWKDRKRNKTPIRKSELSREAEKISSKI